MGPHGEHDLRTLSESLVVTSDALPANLSTDEFLLVLCNVISDTNTLFRTVGPLTSDCSGVRRRMDNLCGTGSADATATPSAQPSWMTDDLKRAFSPQIPFTADYEFDRIRTKLIASLKVWEVSFKSRNKDISGKATLVESTIWPLYHFARLLLSAGPVLYVLPSLAGYVPREYDDLTASLPRPCEPHATGISFTDATVQIAMEVLESVEAAVSLRSSAEEQPHHQCRPIWSPIVLFYGALAIWARMTDTTAAQDRSSRSGNAPFVFRKILQMYHSELSKTGEDWSCAASMAAIVGTLIP